MLVIALLWFELTATDIWLQDFLFNAQHNRWLLDAPGPLLSFIFYDGIKKLLILFALGILICLLVFRNSTRVKHYHHGLRIVLLSLIIVPSVVGVMKATTNVACPRDITAYGGSIPYVRVFESYPQDQRPEKIQQCFPAGHASGGFALMSLYFLFHTKRNRRRGLAFGLTIGCLMAGYKTLLGHHFLSHSIITMILAWLLINLIVLFDDFITRKTRPAENV